MSGKELAVAVENFEVEDLEEEVVKAEEPEEMHIQETRGAGAVGSQGTGPGTVELQRRRRRSPTGT